MTMKRIALAAALLVSAAIAPALAQGPLQTRINFTTTTPLELKGTDVVIPAGNYVLFRILQNDRNLFALYSEDMTHPPIAMIQTAPIYYVGNRYPSKTRILLDTDELSSLSTPVLEGWNVPGDYGWRVTHVVAGRDLLTTRYQSRR